MSNKDEVRSQILRDGETYMVFPNAVVLEIVRTTDVQPAEDAPDWVLGTFQWHGQTIPLLSVALMLHRDHIPEGQKCVVIKTIGDCGGLDCYAVHTDSFPQFISIFRQGMLVDASSSVDDFGSSMSILVGDKSVLVLDLDQVERNLGQWWKAS